MTAPTQPAEGLPELPVPQKECWIGHELFSADQMRAYAREAIATVARERDELRATLRNIADANYREWDDGVNTPFAFVDWAKSRALAALGGDGE